MLQQIDKCEFNKNREYLFVHLSFRIDECGTNKERDHLFMYLGFGVCCFNTLLDIASFNVFLLFYLKIATLEIQFLLFLLLNLFQCLLTKHSRINGC